jgi:hypothetical protein
LVVEVRQHDQYAIRTDGSGCVTLRNRMFLRQYTPFITKTPTGTIVDDRLVMPPETVRQTKPTYMVDILADLSSPLGRVWPDASTPIEARGGGRHVSPIPYPYYSPTPGPNRGPTESPLFHGFGTPAARTPPLAGDPPTPL